MLGFVKILMHYTLAENFATTDPAAETAATAPLTELLRCLILYSQRIIIIGSLQIDWPGSVMWPLKVMGWVWATSSPETLSIDCVLPADTGVPVAAQRVVVYLCVPVVMMIILLLIELVMRLDTRLHSKSTSRATLSDRLGASAMVVAYFFFPAVLRQLFGLFACIPLDQPVEPPRVAKAVGTFWVYDVATQCWAGYHKPLALGLGLPLIVLLCIGLPAAIVYKTASNRHNLDDPVFQQHYGHLTRSYRPSKYWWEAVVTLETVALTAISVFGVNIGAFYQSIVMSAALAIMVQMQYTFRPFAHETTGRAMLRGSQVLLVTSFIGMTFVPTGTVEVDPDIARRYGLVMGVSLLLLNLAYILYVLWLLYKLIDWKQWSRL